MSCGLPIISSDLPCNEDILNNKNAILIDPENTTDIKNAILKLYQDEKLLSDMAEASIKYSESLTLKERAIKIVDFINEKN